MPERYFDPSIAGLSGEKSNAPDMNQAKNDDEKDLPVLPDSDVELIGEPQLPELPEEEIDAALDINKVGTEGAQEQSPAEKSSKVLSKLGNEIVGTDMKRVFEKGGRVKESLDLLTNKFLEQAASLDPGKSKAEHQAVLHDMLASLKEYYDVAAANGDTVAKRVAGDIDSFSRTLGTLETEKDPLEQIKQQLQADLKAGKFRDSQEASAALQEVLQANEAKLRTAVDATDVSGAGRVTELLDLINQYFAASDAGLSSEEKAKRKQELFGDDEDVDIDDVFKVA